MKKIILIAILALVSGIGAIAQDARAIYSKYSDMQGVEAVYISPAMFRMIGRIPDLDLGEDGVNLAPLISSMKGFYVLNTDNAGVIEGLYREVSAFVNKGNYELLLEAKENGEATRIFTSGTENVVKSFILISKDGTHTSFIAIDGEMDRSQLEEAIANAAR